MSATRQFDDSTINSTGRATLLGIALALSAVFLVASLLKPDPRGFGTHQQFGLPPCTFRLLFGIPCPGCGMTTCFAHFVRGQFFEAARANLAGVVLAATCALMIPWSLTSFVIGRTWLVSNPVICGGLLMIILCGLTVALWTVRMVGFFA